MKISEELFKQTNFSCWVPQINIQMLVVKTPVKIGCGDSFVKRNAYLNWTTVLPDTEVSALKINKSSFAYTHRVALGTLNSCNGAQLK